MCVCVCVHQTTAAARIMLPILIEEQGEVAHYHISTLSQLMKGYILKIKAGVNLFLLFSLLGKKQNQQ